MRVSLAAPDDVIDAGFLLTDLDDETGTKTLKVDYSGAFQGHEPTSVRFSIGAGDVRTCSVGLNMGTAEDPHFQYLNFRVRGFVHLIFEGSDKVDVVYGGTSGDTIFGGARNDTLFGNGGGDSIFGGDDEDKIWLGISAEADHVYGGAGSDTVYGVGAQDIVDGGDAGYDKVWMDFGAETEGVSVSLDDLATGPNLTGIEYIGVRLTDFDDSLRLSDQFLMPTKWDAEETCYDLGAGNDRLVIDFRASVREGVLLSPTLLESYMVDAEGNWFDYGRYITIAGYERVAIHGGNIADKLSAQASGTLWGEDGDDHIAFHPVAGTTGRFVVFGGAGDDHLSFWSILTGDPIEDHGPGASFYGGAGDDILVAYSKVGTADSGDDTLSGGKGNDTIAAGNGSDTLIGGTGADLMSGVDQDDLLYGGQGKDTLDGGESRDTLMGGDGADLIYGGGSTDSLAGGAGNDTLSGGYNDDTLTGGAGADTFWFEGERGTKNDVITDYGDGDRLNFAGGLTAAEVTVADSGADLLVSWSTGTVLLLGMAGQTVAMSFNDGLS